MWGVIIDCALYHDGERIEVEPTFACLKDVRDRPGTLAWLGLSMPSVEELTEVFEILGFDEELTVDEVMAPHRRPVLRIEGSVLQLVLRTARYVDRDETISLGELTLLIRDNVIVSVRHGHASPLSTLRSHLEADPSRLAQGPLGILTAIATQVISDYGPALDGFENDVAEVERDVFSIDGPQPVRRLYRLKREVRWFQGPLDALDEPFARLVRHVRRHGDEDLLQDISEASDQLDRTIARIRSLSNLLDAALTASLGQTGIQQNEDMRKISAWVAMAAVPTLVAGIYGMNFTDMPELGWSVGYPLTLLGMVVVVLILYRFFKKNGWL